MPDIKIVLRELTATSRNGAPTSAASCSLRVLGESEFRVGSPNPTDFAGCPRKSAGATKLVASVFRIHPAISNLIARTEVLGGTARQRTISSVTVPVPPSITTCEMPCCDEISRIVPLTFVSVLEVALRTAKGVPWDDKPRGFLRVSVDWGDANEQQQPE